MSNHCGKFLNFAVAAPGSFPDAKALALTRLQQWIDSLPHGFYVLADNAYIISEPVLIPFSGSQQHAPQKKLLQLFPQSTENSNRAGIWTVFSKVENNSEAARNLIGNIKPDPDYMCKTLQLHH